MDKIFLQLGSLLALLGVILGAFGAHSLEAKLSADQLATFETGVRYQFYHSFALILLGIVAHQHPHKVFQTAGWMFALGILFFSGSIYLLACRDMLGISGWRWLGPITPLGGTLFIIGWGCFLWGVSKNW